ncbi:MAG: hypothetical protein U0Z53_07075 [Blastocatellia bacterium]
MATRSRQDDMMDDRDAMKNQGQRTIPRGGSSQSGKSAGSRVNPQSGAGRSGAGQSSKSSSKNKPKNSR